MARVSLIEEDHHPELSELMERIRGARRGRLINVYKLLLHNPALAEAWFALNNAVRWKTRLNGRLRELVIIRIGILCNAPYILRQHIPRLALAEGLTIEECEALQNWQNCALFSPRERAVLDFADALTGEACASEAVFDAVKAFFDQTRIVELSVLIGAYNMHARVMNAVDLDLETPEPA
jgi:4-carboxymuconolactone decarboxylase